MLAPTLIDIIDVIAIPRLTLFFGTRLLHLSACAAAQARDNEEGEKAGDFEADVCVFHFFLIFQKMAQRRKPRLSNEGAANNTTSFNPAKERSLKPENRDEPRRID